MVAQLWHHDGWFDEMQAWLIARASRTPAEMITNLRHEGHPALWHLLLWCSTFISTDCRSVFVVAFLVALGNVSLVVFASPFQRVEKALLIFGNVYVFQYAVMARCYGLGLLLCTQALVVARGRFNRVRGLVGGSLALAANTSLLGLGLSSVCLLLWLRDSRRVVKPWLDLGIFTCGILAAVTTMIPASDVRVFSAAGSLATWSVVIREVLGDALVPWPGPGPFWIDHAASPMLGIVAAVILVALAFRRSPELLALLGVVTTAFVLFGCVVYPFSLRHNATIFCLVLLFLWWRGPSSDAIERYAWRTLLVLQVVCGLATVVRHHDHALSPARVYADWLSSHRAADGTLYPLATDRQAVTLSAYLDAEPVVHLGLLEPQTYAPHDQRTVDVPIQKIIQGAAFLRKVIPNAVYVLRSDYGEKLATSSSRQLVRIATSSAEFYPWDMIFLYVFDDHPLATKTPLVVP